MNARKQAVEKSSITSNVIKSGIAKTEMDATQLDFISSYFQPFLDDRYVIGSDLHKSTYYMKDSY